MEQLTSNTIVWFFLHEYSPSAIGWRFLTFLRFSRNELFWVTVFCQITAVISNRCCIKGLYVKYHLSDRWIYRNLIKIRCSYDNLYFTGFLWFLNICTYRMWSGSIHALQVIQRFSYTNDFPKGTLILYLNIMYLWGLGGFLPQP